MLKNENNPIRIEKLSHQYGQHQVLREIDLSVGKGEIIGLLGPSGTGKTTLIRILTGQLAQTEGRAFLLGEDTRKLRGEAYGKMGMLLDQLGLYERLSCYDNLKLFGDIHGVDKNGIEEVLERVGLYDARKKAVMKLSKGMRQRLLFARAIMHDPRILFLDEPTVGLDPAVMKEIHKMILEQKEKGTTVFLTTHNMEEAERLCDHVALLYEGRIVEYGNPREMCMRYDHQRRIEILLQNEREVTIPNSPEAAEEMAEIISSGKVISIHTTEPDLETVFMELTGANLNV
ncbi:MAG: ABC transporter ATP-binding protein [Lachnospiraceae bacterium]|nr:ABC transporter ATP-binding protein [Lachnospiraceae bacterium]